MAEVIQSSIKKVLKKNNIPDPFFCTRYSISPYKACAHACKYCDGRSEKYFIEGDFENQIHARQNIPQELPRELSTIREKGILSIGSGVTDVYQPIEKQQQLTRKCAEILMHKGQPCFVLTKSSLIQRDLDLWEALNNKSFFLLAMTITTANEKVRELFEPGASPLSERLETLKLFKERGMPVGVYAMPALPGISDKTEDLKVFYSSLKDLGVDFITPGVLTLRPGRQKDCYLKVIENNYPHHKSLYNKIYQENRPSGAPLSSYSREFYTRAGNILNELKIPFLIPHPIYRRGSNLCDEIALLLFHMRELYTSRGINTKPLQAATKNYLEWLTTTRKSFNRRKNLEPTYMDEELILLAKTGNLASIIKNDRLHSFLLKIILERKVLDYTNLQLKDE